MAVVEKRALDRHLDDLASDGKLESLCWGKIRNSGEVKVVSVEIEF